MGLAQHPKKVAGGVVSHTTKQANSPKDQQSTNPQRENKQEHDKELRCKQTSMDLKQKNMENGKRSTNMHKGTNPKHLLKHGCMDVGLDH